MMQLALANLECSMVALVAAPQLLSIMALQPMGAIFAAAKTLIPHPSSLSGDSVSRSR